jgi:hypothetical protein
MAETEPLPDDAFKALMGRMPSEEERRRLAKVKDALGIRSADAIWEVMIALDYHLQLYTTIPDKIAGETRKAVDELRSLVDGRRGRRHDPSISVPPSAWSPAGAAVLGAVAVAFGGICVAAGYLMAERGRPPWGAPGALGAVLGAPAGWLVFVLLLPAATRWVQAGWRAARSRQSVRVRAVGWGLVALSLGTIGVGLALLAAALRR